MTNTDPQAELREQIEQKGWRRAFQDRYVQYNPGSHESPPEYYVTEDAQELEDFIDQLLTSERERVIDENTSDGYHTFKELYEFRKLYNVALFNEWAAQGKYEVHKSTRHHDGEECFGGGWFIVMATLPTGQISNHYEMKDWDLFKCQERFISAEWDGHTSKEVLERLKALTERETE